jgi:hypothetical protein
MENERFNAYYKAQNIVPEDEWESFMNALRQHLPTTFRVAGSRQCVFFSVAQGRVPLHINQQDSKLSQ